VTFSFGIVAPNASHGTLEPIPEIAGVASGVLASFQMICAAVSSALVSVLFAQFGLSGVTAIMLVFALAAGVAYLSVPRAVPRSSRRRPRMTSIRVGGRYNSRC
jgi:DHA1 family bicyclomycin/chloramphenicol resistance-like MFS transporter